MSVGLLCAVANGAGLASGDVADVVVTCQAAAVAPVYPAYAGWLDFLANDGADVFSAKGTACDAAGAMGPRGYFECLHGGQMRRLSIPGETSCAGMTATDSLGLLEWRCDASVAGGVRFQSFFLNPGKGLADAIEPAGLPRFKALSVTVDRNGGTLARTSSTQWWTNPVVDVPAGGVTPGAPGTIYAVRSDLALTGIISLTGARMALLTLPGARLSTTLTTESDLFLADTLDFFWLEGTYDLANVSRIYSRMTRFMTARNVTVLGHMTLNGLGFDVCGPTQGLFEDLRSDFSDAALFTVNGAQRCTFRGLRGVQSGASGNGIFIGNVCQVSTQNHFEDLLLSGAINGVASGGPPAAVNDNRFVGVTVVSSCVGADLGVGELLLDATVVNSCNFGMAATQGQSTFVNVVSDNSNAAGASVDFAGRNSFVNFAAAFGTYGVSLSTDDNYFGGVLELGGRDGACLVSSGTRPGLVDATCANSGSSDASPLTLAPSLAGSLLGKVGPATAFGSVSDWLSPTGARQAWGRDGSAFPAADQLGACAAGQTCRVWDADLGALDGALRGALPVPNGDDVVVHLWHAPDAASCAMIAGAVWGPGVCTLPGYRSQTACEAAGGDWATSKCSSRFLRDAVEISRDLIGNDNGLCESGETCLYTPNLGSYQGHGALVPVGNAFVPGLLTNVTLLRYSVNGR